MFRILLISLIVLASLTAKSDVRLPHIFSDNMVLQNGVELSVWGWADSGEEITVSFGDFEVVTQADASGHWLAKLAPLAVDNEPKDLIITGNNKVSFSNVLVGDVWIFAGQSNMSWPLAESDFGEAVIKDAKAFERIRFIDIPHEYSGEPADDIGQTQWQTSTSESLPNFSAIAFFFARELQQTQDVPLGLILTAVGGSNIKYWISRETQRRNDVMEKEIEAYEAKMARWKKQAALKVYDRLLMSWEKRAEKAKASGRALPPKPVEPVHPKDSYQRHGSYYNGMLAPIKQYAIKGFSFYHGQANIKEPEAYKILFPLLIKDWRRQWGLGNIPFLFVQLANFGDEQFQAMHKRDRLPYLREAQMSALSEAATGMAVTTDLGEANAVHPRNKLDVAKRLVKAAKAIAYGSEETCLGPTLKFTKITGRTYILTFENVGEGLVARGKEGLKGFVITGADRRWVWAEAEIDGNDIHVYSNDVPNPVAVRYNWADNPVGNFYNGDGLPAPAFRTDDWVRSGLSKRELAKWLQ